MVRAGNSYTELGNKSTKSIKETKEEMDARNRNEIKEVEWEVEEQEKWMEEGLMEEETREEWNFVGKNMIFHRNVRN